MKKKVLLLTCLMLALLLAACGSKAPAETTPTEATQVPETTAATEAETTAPTEEETLPPPAKDLIIQTPYADLHFPGDWAGFLKTETSQTPYTVTFFAQLEGRKEPQKLFALTFGARTMEPVGAVKTSSGYVAVAVTDAPFAPDDTWTDSDINVVYTMKEALNHILENLPLEDKSKLNEPAATNPTNPTKPANPTNPTNPTNPQDPTTEPTDPSIPSQPVVDAEDMALDTPYMVLHYPAMWAEYLDIDLKESGIYRVTYNAAIGSHSKVQLFTVYFGGNQGSLLKTIKTEDGKMVEVRIEVKELSLGGNWTEEEKSIVFAMQEDLNYLLARMN